MKWPLGGVLAAIGILPLAACQSPPLPAPTRQDIHITDDDRQVMRTVIDRLVRHPVASSTPPRLILLFDSTFEMCPWTGAAYTRSRAGCIPLNELDDLYALSLQAPRRAEALFRDLNATMLPIGPMIAGDVLQIPAATRMSVGEIRRTYPSASALVAFSRPVYPADRTAVIFFRSFQDSLGFVHMERRRESWSIVSTKLGIE